MKEKLHFIETEQGYMYMINECWTDYPKEKVIDHFETEVDQSVLKRLASDTWLKVRETIIEVLRSKNA